MNGGEKIVKNLVNAQTQPGPLSTISRKPIHKTEMRPKERKRERERKKKQNMGDYNNHAQHNQNRELWIWKLRVQ